MVCSGSLRNSLTQKKHPDHWLHWRLIPKPARIEFGTTDPKAGWHRRGKWNPAGMPRTERNVIQKTPSEWRQLKWKAQAVLEQKTQRIARVLAAGSDEMARRMRAAGVKTDGR